MTERIRHADEPGRNLQIEQIARRPPRPEMTQPHLLAAGMDNHCMRGVDHDIPKAVERSHGHRVDEEELLGSGDLDQTETRMVGLFADEFRIEAEGRTRGQVRATHRQLVGLGNHDFGKISLGALGHHESRVAHFGSRWGWPRPRSCRKYACAALRRFYSGAYSSPVVSPRPYCPSLMHQPASTGRTIPVTKRAASLQRNTAAALQSSGWPGPPTSGCLVRKKSRMAGSRTARWAIGVSIRPGARTLTRIPSTA